MRKRDADRLDRLEANIEAVKADLIVALDRLDIKTAGGIRAILDALTPTQPLPQRKPTARKSAAAKKPSADDC